MSAPGLDQEILGILEGKDDEVVASVVPWILLGALQNADPTTLPEPVQTQLAELFGALGVTAETTGEELNALLARWPRPDEGLIKEINRALRDRTREGKTGDAAFGAALGAVIGSDRVQGALERTAPPPEGAVAGGPLARFAALGVTKKD